MKETITQEIVSPEGVTVTLVGSLLTVKGPKGESTRTFEYPTLLVTVKDNKIILSAKKSTKREKRMIGTFKSHIKNLIAGVQEKFVYKLKICSGHFPMNASVSGNSVVVKNFLGEKNPRIVEFSQNAQVKISGTEVVVSSCSKEDAGQTAAKIEKLCNITDRDRRIFQDGIWITEKAGKLV